MLSLLRPAVVMIALMTLLTGVAYPLAITALAQVLPGPRPRLAAARRRQGGRLGADRPGVQPAGVSARAPVRCGERL